MNEDIYLFITDENKIHDCYLIKLIFEKMKN